MYQAFDLLYLDGRSLLDVPLEERKKLLKLVLRETSRVKFASHIEREGVAFFQAAKAQRLEGIVAKHRRSRYEPNRRVPSWLKIKARPEQELVVGGWTPGENSAKELGALVVGVYEGDKLRFSGKVGSGFDGRARKELRKVLDELTTDRPAFDPPPPPGFRGRWGGDLAGVVWTRPELVIRAELSDWSRDGMVRQSAYKGIERGRDPREVVREVASTRRRRRRQASAEAVPDAPGVPDLQHIGEDGGMPASKTRSAAASPPPLRNRIDPDPGRSRLTNSPPSRRSGTRASGSRRRDPEAHEPEQAAVRRPGGVGRAAHHEARARPLLRAGRAVHAAAPVASAAEPAPLPERGREARFWQKDMPDSAPKWLTIWHETGFQEREDRDANDHLLADRAATLCFLGNLAAFEIHAWTSTIEDPWQPTFALIDIDPGTKTTWDETVTLAKLYRTALEHLGVKAFAKTTGSRGIQAFIPITRGKYTTRTPRRGSRSSRGRWAPPSPT